MCNLFMNENAHCVTIKLIKRGGERKGKRKGGCVTDDPDTSARHFPGVVVVGLSFIEFVYIKISL